MAKSQERIKARQLRKKGKSIRDIARQLKISRSSASLWCRDISLSKAQIDSLHKSMVDGSYVGRLKGAHLQKERKLKKIRLYEKDGRRTVKNLSNRELLMVGLGLHLGEGTKGGSRVRFTNSNPAIVNLFQLWVRRVFHVSRGEICCRVMINEIHRHRIEKVQQEWSMILRIPLSQFQKPVFIKAKNKKIYENANVYLGTMAVTIRKSSDLQYRILGLMQGLVYKLGGYSTAG
jgi:transcriptional regulator with XRE-family HTH domain